MQPTAWKRAETAAGVETVVVAWLVEVRWAQCIRLILALARARHGRVSPYVVASKDHILASKADPIGGLATVNPTLAKILIRHA